MLDDKKLSDYENKNLTDVFKELQSIKSDPKTSKIVSQEYLKKQKEENLKKKKEKQEYLKHQKNPNKKTSNNQNNIETIETKKVNQILNPKINQTKINQTKNNKSISKNTSSPAIKANNKQTISTTNKKTSNKKSTPQRINSSNNTSSKNSMPKTTTIKQHTNTKLNNIKPNKANSANISNNSNNNSTMINRQTQIKNTNNTFKKSNIKNKYNAKKEKTSDLKISHIISGISIIAISTIVLFPKDIQITKNLTLEDISNTTTKYELNKHYLNTQDILKENQTKEIIKQQITEERDTTFPIKYIDIPTLPIGEEIIKQEGQLGKDNFTVIKSITNNEITDELIIKREKITDPVEKIIEYGTSEFLAKLKIHIGDTLYLLDNYNLKAEPDINSEDKAEIKQYLDVKLIDLPNEEWCKVTFDGIEGYIKTNELTSKEITENIEEKSRIQRIMITLKPEMEVNKPSGLTLEDYQKLFNYNYEDKNKIFQNNYKTFYDVEQKYRINGLFLASIAIHESNWGTSQIAKEKFNLFGYGSYDDSPLESSMTFNSYEENIDTVARALVKYYINPPGTQIYYGEIALGTYYNGPTIKDVNTKYASDQEWHIKVYNHMEDLYRKLKNNNSNNNNTIIY